MARSKVKRFALQQAVFSLGHFETSAPREPKVSLTLWVTYMTFISTTESQIQSIAPSNQLFLN